MNELDLLRALRDADAAPPRAEARADARRALLEAGRGGRPRIRRPWALATAGLATAAAVGVALALTTGVDSGRVAPEPARAALERAAVAAEDGAFDVGPGEFLYIRERDAYLGTVGDTPPYSTLEPQNLETWVGRDGAGRIVTRRGELSFPGPRDRARWRADGSPALVGPARLNVYEHGAGGFSVGNHTLSYQELAELPSDGREMYGRLIELAGDAGPSPDGEAFAIIGDLLRSAPVPGRVRAALYRAAAYIKGIRFAGTVTDGLGRRGLAVDLASNHDTRDRLVFDPDTSALLAEQEVLTRRVSYVDAEPGFATGSRLVLEMAVVDSDTARPGS